MDLVNISVEQNEILRHVSIPTDDCIEHSVAVPEMPALKWYKISSLGFGLEKDRGNANTDSENELLDYAASLFANCNQSFSILCERKNREIVYAIGCAEEIFYANLKKRYVMESKSYQLIDTPGDRVVLSMYKDESRMDYLIKSLNL